MIVPNRAIMLTQSSAIETVKFLDSNTRRSSRGRSLRCSQICRSTNAVSDTAPTTSGIQGCTGTSPRAACPIMLSP